MEFYITKLHSKESMRDTLITRHTKVWENYGNKTKSIMVSLVWGKRMEKGH